jgi:hypothetical protein
MASTSSSSQVSVAERASWLLDLATKNREKQQRLKVSPATTTMSSVQDKMQLFEQLTMQPLSQQRSEPPVSLPSSSLSPQQKQVVETPEEVLSGSVSSSPTNTTTTTSSSLGEQSPPTPPRLCSIVG